MNTCFQKIRRKFITEKEIERRTINIKKACNLLDECFLHILKFAKIGKTEIEIAKEIEKILIEKGAESLAFPIIAVSGKRGSKIHGEPTDKKIDAGDFLTLDFGCKINGYCSDMTRTIVFSNEFKTITEKQKEVYDIVLRANKEALQKVKAGMSCFEIDKIARDIIEKAGYGENYIHGTGHGITKEIHDSPTLNKKSKEILKTGDIITIEPGIYIEEEFGVRIEDSLLVLNDEYELGYELLTKSEKELIFIE